MVRCNESKHNSSLGYLLSGIGRMMGGRMRMKLEEFGLSHAQGMVLFHLWRKDGIAQNELSRVLHITPPTATSTLQRMERDGWVRRQRDEADQRIVRVFVTDKALALRSEAGATFKDLDRELISILSDDERAALTASLQKVYDHLAEAAVIDQGPETGEKGEGRA